MKRKIERNPEYLAWVRKQPCCICGYPFGIHAHHTSTGGMGIKGSDMDAVPLCTSHHAEIHSKGKKYLSIFETVLFRLKIQYEKEKQNGI